MKDGKQNSKKQKVKEEFIKKTEHDVTIVGGPGSSPKTYSKSQEMIEKKGIEVNGGRREIMCLQGFNVITYCIGCSPNFYGGSFKGTKAHVTIM